VDVDRIADAWAVLMARLGYDRYGAQGGDWGSMVTTAIGVRDPEHLVGIHLNMPLALPTPADPPTEREQEALDAFNRYTTQEAGYSTQQSTRPQTLGYGLVDSPAGQAGWILEKFTRGPTATVTPRTSSPATSCSTT
jgi:pimeloyl-ACP methyl ester carboxylesterase